MKEKKKISEELLKEAIYDAIREAAIENGKSYGVFEHNGDLYYDLCDGDDALVQFEFDKEFIKHYLYTCHFIDEFIDCYYENNIDDIVDNIKADKSAKVEWDI